MNNWIAIIFASREELRMHSKIPKALHGVCGKPMLTYPVDTLRKAGVGQIFVMVGQDQNAAIKDLLGETVRYIESNTSQNALLTVLQSIESLQQAPSNVIFMVGDAPLIHYSTVKSLMALHQDRKNEITLLTSTGDNQEDIGRVSRNASGTITGVIRSSDNDTRLVINEGIGGISCVDLSWFIDNVKPPTPNSTSESYINSLVEIGCLNKKDIGSLTIDDPYEILEINDRVQLALAESIMRQRIRDRWMRDGVTIIDPPSTFIDHDVFLSQDIVILPNTSLKGSTRIGRDCTIGPGSFIQDSIVGDRCQVRLSVIEESILERDVIIGPFSHLRPGSYAEQAVHIGNFAEIKESRLARGVKMGHFGYIGNATVGSNTNIGAGVVTCNFDGNTKHPTEIGREALIGADTMLIAPVKIGHHAATGAGTVVTNDVPSCRLAVGVPATIREKSH